MTKLIAINDRPVYDVREHTFGREWLSLICHFVGHRSGWISPIVPNPYAITSHIWGCGRCTKTFPQDK